MPHSEPELATHVIALASGAAGARAYEYLREVWARCQTGLGMTEPILDSAAPAEPPADLPAVSGILAAAERPGPGVYQLILRRDVDVFTLSAILSPADSTVGWAALDAQWDMAAGRHPEDVIGEARLYLAKASHLGMKSAARHLQVGHPLWDQGTKTRDGVLIGEVSERADERIERRIVLVAEPGHDTQLSSWAWSQGDLAATPFTRYLMHAAMLRYQLRVWNNARQLRELKNKIDTAVDRLMLLLPTDETSARRVGAAEIVTATGQITSLLAAEAGVVVTATRLREMLRTVEITRSNMKLLLRRRVPGSAAVTLFGDDRELALWLEQRLADDIAYLDAARDRARDATSFADQVLQRLSSEREVGSRRRQEKLTILQTAITGSILMALTVIQALGYHPAVASQAEPALIAFLASVTFALSTRVFGVLLAGRSGLLSALDVLAWSSAFATAAWLALSLVGNVKLGALSSTATTAIIAAAVFAVAAAGWARLTRNR